MEIEKLKKELEQLKKIKENENIINNIYPPKGGENNKKLSFPLPKGGEEVATPIKRGRGRPKKKRKKTNNNF